MSGNVGYQFSENVETRFYFDAASTRQNMPGNHAATTPSTIRSAPTRSTSTTITSATSTHVRIANKTTFRLADTTTVDVRAYVFNRSVKHPIYQYLDYDYLNWGGSVRATDEREIAGHANRLVVGANLLNGENDQTNYENVGGDRGAKASEVRQTQKNVSLYAENTFYVAPSIEFVTGLHYLYAKREQDGRFNADGGADFSLASPKFGLIWDIDPTWQAFAKASRSVEVPSYSEGILAAADQAKAQKAWSYELGTRGLREDFTWEAAVYRMDIRNELQCLFQDFGECRVVNADKTVHQGVELGFGVAILKGLFTGGSSNSGLVAKGEVAESGGDKVWLNVAYTFSDSRFRHDADFGNNELPGAPPHFFRGELLYKHPSGFYGGPNVEWVPQAYYVDDANTEKTKAYALLGAKAGYDAGGAFAAYVEARNLTNEKYISSVSIIDRATPTSALYQPGDGRAVYAGMKYRW